MSSTIKNDEINREIKEIFKDYFLFSKKSSLAYEQYDAKISKKVLHEIRDALDHIAIAVSGSRNDDQIKNHLNEARAHIGRMAVDPIECLAEEKLTEILRIIRYGQWWWRYLGVDIPKEMDIDIEIDRINDLIVEGRMNKSVDINKSFHCMWEAYLATRDLKYKVKPAELKTRFFALGLGLTCTILGVSLRTIVAWIIKF